MTQEELGGAYLYQKIAEQICQNILDGVYRPGDRLPPLRALKNQWNCTQGTIQQAYKELAQQGLVISQAGKGTHVVDQVDYRTLQTSFPLGKAKLVHKAESFLLESLVAGYGLEEIEEAIDLARRHVKAF